jgi:hypothetical protein
MPSVSRQQKKTMRAAAHNPAFAEKMGIPMGVAMEYMHADEASPNRKLPFKKKKK